MLDKIKRSIYPKVISAILLAYFVTVTIAPSLFLNNTPRINPHFIASMAERVSSTVASLLSSTPNVANNPENCTTPTGNETYSGILPMGPHITNHISLGNIRDVRTIYNCDNTNSQDVLTKYIPVTAIYDLLFLKGDVEAIRQSLEEMKKYGLFPIIRVSSYTDNSGIWIKIGKEDARIMGQHLAQALNQVPGFPRKPVVLFGNEVNLHSEWGGQTNPSDFAQVFASFMDGMSSGNFDIYFPALSYGATDAIGIQPAHFLQQFFAEPGFAGKKLQGVGLNIYGPDNNSVHNQKNSQLSTFNQYSSFFSTSIESVITELGPTRDGAAFFNCETGDNWPQAASPLINAYRVDPAAVMATFGCFGSKTPLVILHFDDSLPRMIFFDQITPYPTGTPGATSIPQPSDTPQPTAPPGQPTYTPLPTRAPTTPPGQPTTPPGQSAGSLKIVVHKDSLSGTLWDQSQTVGVYIEGPSSNGHRFGELLQIYGNVNNNCKSRGGFPYECSSAGTAVWRGADGKSGTAPGSYNATVMSAPPGWNIILKQTSGTLQANGALQLDLVVSNKNLPTIPPQATPTSGPIGTCPTSSTLGFDSINVRPKLQPPFDDHPEINIHLRGYGPVNETKGLISRNGNKDGLDVKKPPQISTLYKGPVPEIFNTYIVYAWDFENHKSKAPESATPNFKVHIIGLKANKGQPLYGLEAGRRMGPNEGVFLVLYATQNDLLLTHANSDDLESGYLFYFIDICVDPNLLAKYNSDNAGGRNRLPYISVGQQFGTASDADPKIAIRDSWSFVDPRYKEDWWFYQE